MPDWNDDLLSMIPEDEIEEGECFGETLVFWVPYPSVRILVQGRDTMYGRAWLEEKKKLEDAILYGEKQ